MNPGVPSFQDPWVLAALALLPLLAWRQLHLGRRGALTYSSLPHGTSGAWRLHLPFVLRLAALALLIVAAARPQLGFAREESLTEGIDIQIVLDVSGSMAAEDFQPRNRLHVAKEVMADFVERRPGDRVGIVVFAGRSLTKAPLTSDRTMLGELLDSIELHTLPDGTAIGLALAHAAGRLKDSDAETRIVVLVTDGVNNRGAIDPGSAAAICEGLGIRVYTVGVGTDGRVPVPMMVEDRWGNVHQQRVMMDVEVDEELLREIADRTGGKYFAASDPEGLRRTFAEIDELEKTPLQIQRYVRYEEAFSGWVWGALALLLAPAVLALAGWTTEP